MSARLKEVRGTCPACSYPAAYSETTGKNGQRIGWCASCQDGKAIAAVLRGAGGDEARDPEPTPAKDKTTLEAREKAQERARIIWVGAATITVHDPAGKYLVRRALGSLIDNPALRYRMDVSHPMGGRHPAMVALVKNGAGEPIGCHRTYVAQDGTKARLEPVKASLGPIWGGAIRLAPAAAHIVIGEGIETSASAGLMLGLPAWAAISAGNLAKGLVLPAEIREVTIAADDDGVNAKARNPGLNAAEGAAARWQREGRKVRIIKPKMPGSDFNDVLMTRMAKEAE